MKTHLTILAIALSEEVPYRIVGTGQDKYYDNRNEIPCPRVGQPFHGQDAQNKSLQPTYKHNGDGTESLPTGAYQPVVKGKTAV